MLDARTRARRRRMPLTNAEFRCLRGRALERKFLPLIICERLSNPLPERAIDLITKVSPSCYVLSGRLT